LQSAGSIAENVITHLGEFGAAVDTQRRAPLVDHAAGALGWAAERIARGGVEDGGEAQDRLRACWVTKGPVGWAR
jgi:hypothetical protein